MNSELIECPACKHALRVPENLFDKTVRCPECKTHFTAPTRDDEGKLGQPVLLPQLEQPRPVFQPRGKWDSPLFMPAMLLILVSFAGTLLSGLQTVIVFTDPERAEGAGNQVLEQYAKITKQDFTKEEMDRAKVSAFGFLQIAFPVFFSFSLIALAGGFCALFRRCRWLAIIGSLLAMLNFMNCCCLLGLPAGGYCLIKLIDPDMKPLFQRSQ